MRLHHFLGAVGSERADQLVLEILDADEEPEGFHAGASEADAEAGALERASEVALLTGVAEAREPDVDALRPEHAEEASDGLSAAHRHDGNALAAEITPAEPGQRLDGALVADALDEHDGTCRERFVRHVEE